MKDIKKIEINIQVSSNEDKKQNEENVSQNVLRYNDNYRAIFELKQKLLWEGKDDEY